MAASLHAQLCDLLGDDPYEDRRDDVGEVPRPRPTSERPTVAAAALRCPRGALVAARDGDEPVVVIRLADGRAAVLPDRCPHDGGPLSDGFVEGDQVVCARHGWELDPISGRCSGRAGLVVPTRLVRS
jgi:nitrite reductase/ring-hydroxylating ferredoxin subunit